jgi:hypothetical protein
MRITTIWMSETTIECLAERTGNIPAPHARSPVEHSETL